MVIVLVVFSRSEQNFLHSIYQHRNKKLKYFSSFTYFFTSASFPCINARYHSIIHFQLNKLHFTSIDQSIYADNGITKNIFSRVKKKKEKKTKQNSIYNKDYYRFVSHRNCVIFICICDESRSHFLTISVTIPIFFLW